MWSLWKHRNSMIFNNVVWIFITQVWREILRIIRYWMMLSTKICKERLERFLNMGEALIRQPLLILGG